MRRILSFVPVIAIFLAGVWIGRAMFPKEKPVTKVITTKEFVIDTVFVKKKIFWRELKPLEVQISNKLLPPEIIFKEYNCYGLWTVERTKKEIRVQGFVVKDSLRSFTQKWRLNLGREWVLQPNFEGGQGFYTLRVKNFALRRFWGVGFEYSRNVEPFLEAGLGWGNFEVYGVARQRGLALGVRFRF